MLFVVLLVAVGVAGAFQPPLSLTTKRYDGYKVLRIFPENAEAVGLLHHLMITDNKLDFWQEPSNVGSEVHMMVRPDDLERVYTLLDQAGIGYGTHIDDVQSQLTPMWNAIDQRRLRGNGKLAFDINDYNTLEDIYSWMDSLVANCRVGLTCEVYSVGDSYDGLPIKVFKISKPEAGRKAYWLDSTIHAREWIATATNLQILNHLATGGDGNATRLTDSYDWYIMPVMNPDGYKFSWDSDRMWRKNRRPSGSCFGVDLNRNFDFRWGTDGVSFNPCDETYCGANGGSEPETQAVSAELNRVGPTLGASVTIHSYGNMWMFPWGNTIDGRTCELAADHDELMAVANPTADAIEDTNKTKWSRGNSCVVIYATTGGTDDYAKGVSGVKYAFCPELRGNSFVIPASNIPLSFNEVWNGVVVMCNTINA